MKARNFSLALGFALLAMILFHPHAQAAGTLTCQIEALKSMESGANAGRATISVDFTKMSGRVAQFENGRETFASDASAKKLGPDDELYDLAVAVAPDYIKELGLKKDQVSFEAYALSTRQSTLGGLILFTDKATKTLVGGFGMVGFGLGKCASLK